MIPFHEITKLFASDPMHPFTVEIEFCVRESAEFSECWMGRTPERKELLREGEEPSPVRYWFGLKKDGTAAYDYRCFADFAAAPVFGGKSLEQIWDQVELLSIDGCDPAERLRHYRNTMK